MDKEREALTEVKRPEQDKPWCGAQSEDEWRAMIAAALKELIGQVGEEG